MKEPGKTTELFRKILLSIDITFHIVAAFLLLVACGFILFNASLNILEPSRASMIAMINDVLLSLIILELLWTVIRFLKKQKFILAPFLAIGIIAAVRRILLIEAQTSAMAHTPVEKLYEIGLSAVVILILMAAHYLSVKAQKLEEKA
ncbi:hypothetical protein BMS3Abin09_00459 [bacterium BMS3Abin09]|nr:hypothetical protein BMS3Abin09_00459 [bacterium BMS3Abin09]GBE40756.1 hypothetical protein BMS3Bbin09_00642 [bacterium BMS3Bbin09]